MVLKRYNTCFLLEDDSASESVPASGAVSASDFSASGNASASGGSSASCGAFANAPKKLLVDAGGGNEILVRLDKLGVSIRDIGAMFVTHSHTDHILGTPWVIRAVITEILENGYDGNFTVCSFKETLSHVRQICEMSLGKKMTKLFDDKIIFREITDGEEINLAGFDLKCFDICSTKMKQFGFVLPLAGGGKLCFPGEEPLKPECEHFAENADWLFSEAYCLFADAEKYQPYKRSHVTSLDAAKMAERLGAKNLVIYHTADYGDDRKELMTREAKTVYGGNVFVPDDMETIQIKVKG